MNPTPVVILITDGQANGCSTSGTSAADTQGPIDEVSKAAAQGIKTFVVGVEIADAGVQDTLDTLAQLGDTGASAAYTLEGIAELVTALESIAGRI